MDDDDVR